MEDGSEWTLKDRTPLCKCLSEEEKLKAVGPFYMVYMPGEVKYPHPGGKCVTSRGLHHS